VAIGPDHGLEHADGGAGGVALLGAPLAGVVLRQQPVGLARQARLQLFDVREVRTQPLRRPETDADADADAVRSRRLARPATVPSQFTETGNWSKKKQKGK